jgi:hypothetical protein
MTYQGLMFSIIIPNYNNAEWLDKCFTSIYEQRRKDIRKAGFEYIMGLSKALHCEPADLMERLT